MKAIILERRGEEVAVLREDGVFDRTRHAGEIGETIELTENVIALPEKKHISRMRGIAAAALVFLFTGGPIGYMTGTASAYVSLEAGEDSAVELTVNHFGRVIGINALDDNVEALADNLSDDVWICSVDDAIEIVITRMEDEGYLDEENDDVIVGVSTDNEDRAAELKKLAEQSIEESGEYKAYVSKLSRAERDQAMKQNISAGRLGFERDHGGTPDGDNRAAGLPADSEQQTSTDTDGNNNVSGSSASQAKTGSTQSATANAPSGRSSGQSTAGQNAQAQNNRATDNGAEQTSQEGVNPDPRQDLPLQGDGQPGLEQDQQNGGDPSPEQEQPPQNGADPAPEQQQPSLDSEDPETGHNDPSQTDGQSVTERQPSSQEGGDPESGHSQSAPGGGRSPSTQSRSGQNR